MRPLFCLRPCLLDRNKPHFVCRTKIALDCVGARRASQCTQRRDQLCQTDAAFSCPLLKTGLWECFPSERVNVWAWRGSVCAGNQKFFSTTACSWAFIGSRQGYQLPRSTNPSEGTVGNQVVPTLSGAFSGQTSSVCTDDLFSPALTTLTCSFLVL